MDVKRQFSNLLNSTKNQKPTRVVTIKKVLLRNYNYGTTQLQTEEIWLTKS